MADTAEAGSGSKKRSVAIIAAVLIGLLVIGGALWWVFTRAGTTKITAYFDKSVGIYDAPTFVFSVSRSAPSNPSNPPREIRSRSSCVSIVGSTFPRVPVPLRSRRRWLPTATSS